jgi:6-phosphogluconolactonase (cycloisomerase 2 family)
MRCAFVLLSLLSPFLFSQNASSAALTHSPVQVLYVTDLTSLYTYNIDPQTLQPSLMATIPLPNDDISWISTTSDGRFLYVMADTYPPSDNRIYVYETNGYGVPGEPVQSVKALAQSWMRVDPANHFLYTVHQSASSSQDTRYSILGYPIDPSSGMLSRAAVEADYQLSNAGGCFLELPGTNTSGTILYVEVYCGISTTIALDEYKVNLATGALEQPLQHLQLSQAGNTDTFQFAKNYIFDFDHSSSGANQLRIYAPGRSQPLIDCTGEMLADCGIDPGFVHPSAQFLFYPNPQQNIADVDAVDFHAKQVVSTGTTFAAQDAFDLYFSPTGTVVYSWDQPDNVISIFGFDPTTGAITRGGSITPPDYGWIVPAERH